MPELTNVVLAMSDDQGWGEVGYRHHRLLDTPHLVAMAANGLRFERFYACPICSPTRASVLTGRAADRTGVLNQGKPLRLQERHTTIAAVLRRAGWATRTMACAGSMADIRPPRTQAVEAPLAAPAATTAPGDDAPREASAASQQVAADAAGDGARSAPGDDGHEPKRRRY